MSQTNSVCATRMLIVHAISVGQGSSKRPKNAFISLNKAREGSILKKVQSGVAPHPPNDGLVEYWNLFATPVNAYKFT